MFCFRKNYSEFNMNTDYETQLIIISILLSSKDKDHKTSLIIKSFRKL